MDNAGYTTLTRQSGLMREMTVIANNIANAATTGYRQEGLIFSEFVQGTDDGPSLSMAAARVHNTSFRQGALTETGSSLDFAIEGEGFFQVQTPEGQMLTRAGSFATSAAGDLVTNDGHPVLDPGGAPIFIPPDAVNLGLAGDGTLSADGAPIGQLGVVRPADPLSLQRHGGTMFSTDGGVEPVDDPRVVQGFIESSNVDAIGQIGRMIQVQRAYELGQTFLEREDDRIRTVARTLIK
ncbi:flagellar hook-basal body complex protein [Pseudooceanicola sp. HF7]|uniref:flagellar hook-basal body complex protein n=1 Tax=Pseudooceanicola sp. HF7 TaxID=2721560 RepID=UPI001432180F|nr:flagellar hook-basal body complex protein [Pseudooceanicola sp. HF7]NIZ09730.1 flagellar hook-basal body complex protein [Pseudooceanicola sp. HF7]